jgi:hypothetical protein
MRLIAATLAALVLVPVALASTRPHVRLARQAPAVVAGGGFHAGEHVRVRVTNGSLVLSKRILTSSSGGFSVHFLRGISVPVCGQLAITAVGTLGDRAAFKTPPQACGAQPPTSG